jgi:DNA polymerase I
MTGQASGWPDSSGYDERVALPILILDAYSLLFRAFFALPPLTTKAGVPTSGLYGLTALLIKLLREQRPKGAVFAIDLPRPTFRHRAFPAYKQTRTSPPSALHQQLARLPAVIEAFGCISFSSPGFEADDILATLARELGAMGEVPMVVTGDRDALQLARGGVTVLYAARGVKDTKYDEAAVRRRFGVAPEQLPDYAALVGDPSDNIPGVNGIGAQTAAHLVTAFGDISGVLANLSKVEPPRLRSALEQHAADLVLWRDLSRLRDDVPLPAGPRFCPLTRAARAGAQRLCEELEFFSLLPRLDEAFAGVPDDQVA